MTDGCPTRLEVAEFVAGESDDTRGSVLERHLSQCERCQAVADELTDDQALRAHWEDSLRLVPEHQRSRWQPHRERWYRAGNDGTEDRDADRASAMTPDVTRANGELLGRFQIVRQLGSGGFGIVYLAYDPKLDRHVALKTPRTEAVAGPRARRQFLREARAAAALQHPHIVSVFESGETEETCYLASAYCPGGTLAEYLDKNKGSLPFREAASLIAILAEAVHYAHENGVLHCDLKPSNVLLDTIKRDSQDSYPIDSLALLPFLPRLTDFGLARFFEPVPDEPSNSIVSLESRGQSLSFWHSIAGTPSYMAPEQIEGRVNEIGRATDVYGLGAMLYELLTGKTPFGAGSRQEILHRVVRDETPPVRQWKPSAPRDLEAICLKSLEKKLDRRYATAGELSADLRRFLRGDPTVARPASLWKRVWRPIARRPTLSLTMVFCLLFLLVATLGGTWYKQEQLRRQQEGELLATREERQKKELNERLQLYQARQERDYVNGIRLAVSHWRENSPDSVDGALQSLRPGRDEFDCREFVWHYLSHHRTKCTKIGGRDIEVEAVVSSRDGLISASNQGHIQHWNLESRRVRRDVQLRERGTENVTFSEDGKRLLTLGQDGSSTRYFCWDVQTGNLIRELKLPQAPTSEALSPNGQLLALAGEEFDDGKGQVVLWEPSTDKARVVWKHGQKRRSDQKPGTLSPSALKFSVDGQRLAVAVHTFTPTETLANCQVEIVELATNTVQSRIAGHISTTTALAFSPDGQRLATSGYDGETLVWALNSDKALMRLPNFYCPIRCLVFSPDGKQLATGMNWPGWEIDKNQSYVTVWDLATQTKRPPPFLGVPVLSLAYRADGRSLAIGCSDKTLRVWDLSAEFALQPLNAHGPREAWGIAFARDGSMFATGGDDHLAKVWDARTQREIARCATSTALITAVAFAPHRSLLASAGYDGVIRFSDPRTGQENACLRGHVGPVRSLAFSPDGRLLASAGDDRLVRLWDVNSGTLLFESPGHENKIRQVVFSPVGLTLFSGDNDGVVCEWDVATGKQVRALPGYKKVSAIAPAPHEKSLAIAIEGGTIHRRRSDTWELEFEFVGHTDEVLCLAYSPDGKTIASGGRDRSVRLWHAATGQELISFTNLPAQINGIAFSADGTMLAATCHDGNVHMWTAGSSK